MLRFAAIIVLCFLLPDCVQAQPVRRGFFVADAETKIPIAEAFVQSPDHKFYAVADATGFIDTHALQDTVTVLLVSCVGFQSQQISVNKLSAERIVYLDTKAASLDEVTVQASVGRSPYKSISDLDIRLRPVSNAQEVLRQVPGLFIGQHAGGGKAEQLFLRGFDVDHGTDVAITVDGLPVNMVSHAHGQGYADLHFVIPELIDRVDFNKGPYNVANGNFTTAGSVDFRQKAYLDHPFVKVEAGPYATARTVFAVNLLPSKNARRQSLYAAGEASYTNGYFNNPQHFYRFNGLLKYQGQIGNNTQLTASVSGFNSKWKASGQIPERAIADGSIDFYGAIDPDEGGATSRYNAIASLHTRFASGGTLQQTVYYTRYLFELYSDFTFFKDDPVYGDMIRQKEARDLLGYTAQYQQRSYLGSKPLQTTIGAQLRYDAINNIELAHTTRQRETLSEKKLGDIHEGNAAVYASQNLQLSHRLDVTAGLRFDYFSNRYADKLLNEKNSVQADILSPKLNISFRPQNQLQLYVYMGRGFHSNDTRVAVQEGGRRVLPAAYGADAGAVYKPIKKLVLHGALWYLWLGQEFIYVGDEGVVEPGGKTRRMGLDLSIRYEVLKNLFADADLSLAVPRAIGVAKGEQYLPLAPSHTSVGGLTYKKQQGFNGSLRYRYMGDRPANEDRSVIASGYFIVDGTVSYAGKKWEGGIAVSNLFNTKWKETQFLTESRLQHELQPVAEIHFTAGTPFFPRAFVTIYF